MSCETIKTKDFKKKTPEQKNKKQTQNKAQVFKSRRISS